MKKTKDLKTSKGITLIALVITIIVMLILVAVTISMAVNGGLFEYAGKAVGDTNNALKAEGQLINDIIDEYIKPNLPETETVITAETMQSDLASYLGQTIAYGVEYEDASDYGNGEWEIFYADGEHIYIITRGHLAAGKLTTTGYNGTSDFTDENLQSTYPAVAAGLLNKTYDPTSVGSELKYTSSYDNMKATQYLLDSTVWATYANDDADWAIGAPTLELFVNSYNAYYPDKTVTLETPSGFGYRYSSLFSNSNAVSSETYLNHSFDTSFWFACPSYNDDLSLGVINNNSSSLGALNDSGGIGRELSK